MSNRVFRLMQRHQRLDEKLRQQQASRWPDPFAVARLKKLKLAVKDRMARLARQPVAG